MATLYTATLSHHSIAASPLIQGYSQASVERRAWERFRGGFLDHQIIVRAWPDDGPSHVVARRYLAAPRWAREA